MRGMTFGQFNEMMHRYVSDATAGKPCVHPFNILGLAFHTRHTRGSIVVTVDYQCPTCHEVVGTAERWFRTNQ